MFNSKFLSQNYEFIYIQPLNFLGRKAHSNTIRKNLFKKNIQYN